MPRLKNSAAGSNHSPPIHVCCHSSVRECKLDKQTVNDMASRKNTGSSAQAEVVLLPSLKNCLLNLPSSLVSVLLNSNAVVQNVVVELIFRQTAPTRPDSKDGKPTSTSKSVFLGWTGMQSQTKMGGLVRRDDRQEREVPTVEVDSTFGRLIGLTAGEKVSIRAGL